MASEHDCMKTFHTETLRALSTYLKESLDCTSRSALQSFACGSYDCSDSSAKNISIIHADVTNQASAFRRRLIGELRVAVLMCLSLAKKCDRTVLRRYHFYTHLMELGMDIQKSMCQKLREILNTNFALHPNDVIGHACRGNYEEIARYNSMLMSTYEEPDRIHTTKASGTWEKKSGMPRGLSEILSGQYKGFGNRLEEHCYKLLHGMESSYSDDYTRILQGNFESLVQSQKGWLKLGALMATARNASLREYESCFECLFHETFELDFKIGLEYLSYSRKCVFYFDSLVDKVPQDAISIGTLLSLARINGLDLTGLVRRYGGILQESKEYEELCNLVLKYSISDFGYSRDSMVYFIKNFPRLRPLAAKCFKTHAAGMFIASMSSMESLEEELLHKVLESKYFSWFYDEITDSILRRGDVSDELMLSLIGRLLETESRTSTSTRDAKARVMEKLIG